MLYPIRYNAGKAVNLPGIDDKSTVTLYEMQKGTAGSIADVLYLGKGEL